MLKFTYVIFLAATSILLFIFSKDKNAFRSCTDEASGTVTLVSDSTDKYLEIVTKQNVLLRPTSMSEDVVLAAGQKVTICYSVDSSSLAVSSNTFIPVHIEKIDYHH